MVILITSNYILQLTEDWLRDISTRNFICSIYVNPGSSDFVKLYKSFKLNHNTDNQIRFIADAKQQKVYVWDAINSTHDIISQKLDINYSRSNNYVKTKSHVLYGYGFLRNGRLVFDSDGDDVADLVYNICNYYKGVIKNDEEIKGDVKYLNQIFKYDWGWLDKYINGVTLFMKTQKQKFITWLKKPL